MSTHPTRADRRPLDAAAEAAVVCDLAPLAILAIDGADATAFLNGQLSNDAAKLTAGTFQYTSYNSPGGRVLANMNLWRDTAGGDGFRALIPGDIAEPIRKRLAMFVLRSKVKLADLSAVTTRLGIGGPLGGDAIRTALGIDPPAAFAVARSGSTLVLGLPGSRYLVVAPSDEQNTIRTAFGEHAQHADFNVWRWLTVHAGVPVITTATQDKFVPQMLNWDVLGGINFQKGCYTGQEIIARMQYLGRLKERLHAFASESMNVPPGERLFSAAFGDQPCGTVVNSAASPRGGLELLAVLQMAAADTEVTVGAPDGPKLVRLPLPYSVPEAAAPRARIG